jgi:ABC-type transport system involved in multi-copper enzyme maturation permease subunit
MTPIIRRELLEWMRTRKALALQVGLAAVCAILILVRWPTGGVGELSGARSLEVLRVFGYGALAGILLLAPALPATTLVREKMSGTLALLLNSPLSGQSIYFGKLLASLGFTAILLTMTVPAAAACYALGGTTIRGGVGLLYAILCLAALQVSTLGLLVSSRSQSTDGALRVTYGLVLAVCVLPLAPHWLLQGSEPPLSEIVAWIRGLSPIPAVMEVLGQGDVGSRGMSMGGGAMIRYAVMASLMSVLCALATFSRVNHKMLDRARPAGIMTKDRALGTRIMRRMLFLVDPQRRSRGISRFVNPVMVKEFRTRRFGRAHWILRLVALCAILSLALSYLSATGALGWGLEAIGGALVLLQISLLILFVPSLAGGLISTERESGGWRLLLMTPLSAGAILRGKLMSVVWPLILLLCATLPGYIVMMHLKPTLEVQVYRVVATLVLTATFAVLVSAAASSLFRSTAAATTTSYSALLAICLGPLLIWLGRGAPFGHRAVETILTVSPVAAALHASDTPGFTDYALLPANWWLITAACLALLTLLVVRTWQLSRPD